MSTKAIREVIHDLRQRALPTEAELNAMEREVEAIEKAAKDLTRLHLSDGADHVAHREHVIQAMTDDPASQWNHPDVVAWGEASHLLAQIAKEAP